MKRLIKNNLKVIVAFVLGAILFGSIGYVVATGMSSEDVTYNHNNQSTVENALDDLYTKANRLNSWVDPYKNFVSHQYWVDSNQKHESNISLINSRTWYDNPVYLKSTELNGANIGYQVCTYLNNNEFCMASNYWVGDAQDQIDGSTTKEKLRADMEANLGIPFYSDYVEAGAAHSKHFCESWNSGAICYTMDDIGCIARADGSVECWEGPSALQCIIDAENNFECDLG